MTSKSTSRRQDLKGGLTAAGRKYFNEKEGAHLRPGVSKQASKVTTKEMKRKGMGRSLLRPFRHAASFKEGRQADTLCADRCCVGPVPKTVAAARKIADKGRRLLKRAKKAA